MILFPSGEYIYPAVIQIHSPALPSTMPPTRGQPLSFDTGPADVEVNVLNRPILTDATSRKRGRDIPQVAGPWTSSHGRIIKPSEKLVAAAVLDPADTLKP